jgi:hypothetical protein
LLSASTGLRIGADQRSMDRTTDANELRGMLFNNLLQDDLGTGRWPVLHVFADVAQQAEHDHATVEATSSRLVIRSTSGVSVHSVAA